MAPDPLTEEEVYQIVDDYQRRTRDEIKTWFRNLEVGDEALARAGIDTADVDRQGVGDELEEDKTTLDRPNNPDILRMVGQAAVLVIEHEIIRDRVTGAVRRWLVDELRLALLEDIDLRQDLLDGRTALRDLRGEGNE